MSTKWMNHVARRAFLAAASAAIFGTVFAASAAAQSYPNKPIRMVVPWPAGGATDIAGRRLAEGLTRVLGQPIIVDNRGGANQIVGTEIVAKAPPDGYTIMVAELISHTANPSMYKKLPYDTVKDFAPVTQLNAIPMVIVAYPLFPAKNIGDLLQMAKAKPGAISHASFGMGSLSHLAAEIFKMMGNIDMVHVPYKGGGPALIGTMAGEASVYFSAINAALPHIKSGRLRALAVTGSTRSKALPDVPTVAETPEFKGYEASVLFGVLVPARTPQDIIARLHDAIVNIIQTPKFRHSFEAEGASDPIGNTPEQMSATIHVNMEKMAKVIKAAGITSE